MWSRSSNSRMFQLGATAGNRFPCGALNALLVLMPSLQRELDAKRYAGKKAYAWSDPETVRVAEELFTRLLHALGFDKEGAGSCFVFMDRCAVLLRDTAERFRPKTVSLMREALRLACQAGQSWRPIGRESTACRTRSWSGTNRGRARAIERTIEPRAASERSGRDPRSRREPSAIGPQAETHGAKNKLAEIRNETKRLLSQRNLIYTEINEADEFRDAFWKAATSTRAAPPKRRPTVRAVTGSSGRLENSRREVIQRNTLPREVHTSIHMPVDTSTEDRASTGKHRKIL